MPPWTPHSCPAPDYQSHPQRMRYSRYGPNAPSSCRATRHGTDALWPLGYIQNRIPFVIRHAHEQVILGDTCVIDQNINAAHRLGRLLWKRFNASASDSYMSKCDSDRPIHSANASNGSRRVPLIATVAPAACRDFAIAPPMPPDAPVISAFLPVKSNIILSLCLCRCGGICCCSNGFAVNGAINAAHHAA